jgi:hypothetical protein
VGTLSQRPQLPVSWSRYALALGSSAVLVGCGLSAVALVSLLRGYDAFVQRRHVAEVQCIEIGPSQLRVYYVPVGRDGAHAATETYDVTGDEWTVAGEVLRFRPSLAALGVESMYRVSRIEGRWLQAADARAHHGSAYDREAESSRKWLGLLRYGTSGPLGWFVAGAHGQAVSQLPDRKAVYDLYVTSQGFVVDKRSL